MRKNFQINKLKDTLHSDGRILLKCPEHLKGSRHSMQCFQIPMAFSPSRKKKFIWNYKIHQRVKANLSKINKAESITHSDFKLLYKAILTKTIRYWHKNRHTDQ